MNNFKQFEEYFDFILDKYFDSDISEFIWNQDKFKEYIDFKLEVDLDDEQYDSYGNEDTSLNRIYYFPKFEIYISFYGTRCSYQGEEWNGYKEVKPVTKTITSWE